MIDIIGLFVVYVLSVWGVVPLLLRSIGNAPRSYSSQSYLKSVIISHFLGLFVMLVCSGLN